MARRQDGMWVNGRHPMIAKVTHLGFETPREDKVPYIKFMRITDALDKQAMDREWVGKNRGYFIDIMGDGNLVLLQMHATTPTQTIHWRKA